MKTSLVKLGVGRTAAIQLAKERPRHAKLIAKFYNKGELRPGQEGYLKDLLDKFDQSNLSKDLGTVGTMKELEKIVFVKSLPNRYEKQASLTGYSVLGELGAFAIYLPLYPDALCDLGHGTKWCTRRDYGKDDYEGLDNARSYMDGQKKIYVVYKNGKPYLQMSGVEYDGQRAWHGQGIMTTDDEPYRLTLSDCGLYRLLILVGLCRYFYFLLTPKTFISGGDEVVGKLTPAPKVAQAVRRALYEEEDEVERGGKRSPRRRPKEFLDFHLSEYRPLPNEVLGYFNRFVKGKSRLSAEQTLEESFKALKRFLSDMLERGLYAYHYAKYQGISPKEFFSYGKSSAEAGKNMSRVMTDNYLRLIARFADKTGVEDASGIISSPLGLHLDWPRASIPHPDQPGKFILAPLSAVTLVFAGEFATCMTPTDPPTYDPPKDPSPSAM